jgi:diguanylate cyclase (GGDEF)-like protein/PAS domain S-box-containing protein
MTGGNTVPEAIQAPPPDRGAPAVLRRLVPWVVPASAGLAAVSTAWFAVMWVHPWGPRVVGWLSVPICAILAAAACWQASTACRAVPAAARFWARLALTMVILAPATIANAHDELAGPTGVVRYGPVSMTLYVLAVLASVWALAGFPLRRRTTGRWLTLALDAGTVMVAAALFTWHFSTRHSLELRHGGSYVWGLLALVALDFVAVLTVVKLAFAGVGPIDRRAMVILAGAVFSGAAGGALAPLMEAHPQVNNAQLVVPVTSFVMVLAADRQRRAARRGPCPPRPRRRRPYSLLPYAAVAATDLLSLQVIGGPVGEARVVIVGAAVLTGLVVVRQIGALTENARLLSRVDASLLDLSRHEQRFRSLVQNASDIITITDVDGVLRYASPGLERLLGVPQEAWLGSAMRLQVHPEDRAVLERRIAEIMESPGASTTFQARVRHRDGSWRWFDVISRNLLNDPSVGGVVSNARDVTETRHFQDQLTHQASHDALTQLANRSLFGQRTARALADQQAGLVSVALVDLDDFKAINDRLGHTVGDALLVAVAERLRQCVRRGDTVARLGGDEFAVLLEHFDADDDRRTAERIIAALAAPLNAAGYQLLVQASVGIAEAEPGVDADELLRRADVAMYAAKARGKGRHMRFDPVMDSLAAERSQLGAALAHALERGELHLEYQPIVALPDARVLAVEALARWHHPTRGLVGPDCFIPVAESTGLVGRLGQWVLLEACRRASSWGDNGDAASVAVNVSARQLREPDFADLVGCALRASGLPPRRLVIEVTETAVFDSEPGLRALRRVRELGVRVALDDFGTGHSSLGLLRTCPVDIIKVDKSFVEGVTGTDEQAAIATSLVQIAAALHLKAIAEGVETRAQAARLHQLGYRYAQGFHFSRPLPATAIDDLVATAGHALPARQLIRRG